MGTYYFVGQKLVGVSHRQPYWDDARPSASSTAYLCPTCGSLWGRVVVTGTEWQALHRLCAAHGSGSFIAPWRSTFEELPREVLDYELQTLLTNFDKENPACGT